MFDMLVCFLMCRRLFCFAVMFLFNMYAVEFVIFLLCFDWVFGLYLVLQQHPRQSNRIGQLTSKLETVLQVTQVCAGEETGQHN